jgi:hypothetical protein
MKIQCRCPKWINSCIHNPIIHNPIQNYPPPSELDIKKSCDLGSGILGHPVHSSPGSYQPIQSGKTPHKCPVCEGSGRLLNARYGMLSNIGESDCHACKGEGIVWG